MSADLILPRRSVKGTGNWDDNSWASFVRRRLGREALERMPKQMFGGIYTADPETLSLRATLPRFLDMEREYRSVILGMLRRGRTQANSERQGTSGARYSLFLSFDGGMQVLVDELSAVIAGGPVLDRDSDRRVPTEIRFRTRVETLERSSAASG